MAKFFCCLPLRVGVWLFTLLFFAWGTVLTVIGWYGVANYNSTTLAFNRRQRVSLIITTASWTLLPVITIYGFGATLGRNYKFLSFYATLLWFQFGASVGAGAYFIYTLYRRMGDGFFVTNCNERVGADIETCRRAFSVLRAVIIAVYIVIWLVQIWGGVTIQQYSTERKNKTRGNNYSQFGRLSPQVQPTLPVVDPVMMPPPAPPTLMPAPAPRFGPRSSGSITPPSGPAPAFTQNAGGVSLPPPVPFNNAPPVAPTQFPGNGAPADPAAQYAFTAPGNSYGAPPPPI